MLLVEHRQVGTGDAAGGVELDEEMSLHLAVRDVEPDRVTLAGHVGRARDQRAHRRKRRVLGRADVLELLREPSGPPRRRVVALERDLDDDDGIVPAALLDPEPIGRDGR